MVDFKKINEDNFDECVNLKVKDTQKTFVASNLYSLAQAYVEEINNECIMPYAIYHDDIMVGFIMMEIENGKDVYWICRFMIDEKYQGKGYGKQSMLKALDFIREKEKGKHTVVCISYEPENLTAKKLYESVGFEETGEICDGELVAKLVL